MIELQGDWPEHLIVPSEDQFQHGTYIRFESPDPDIPAASLQRRAALGLLNEPDREVLRNDCGTACCFVGWIALAFGEKGCSSTHIRNPATIQFLNKFLELAGDVPIARRPNLESFEYFADRLGTRASEVFEGDDGPDANGRFRARDEMTPVEARDLWKRTGAYFNYDTENLLE